MVRLNEKECDQHAASSVFPIGEAPGHNGMVISLSGVLQRAADECRRHRDSRHLEFSLRELLKHLADVRASSNDKEGLQRMDAFFKLYVIE
jgi:hypothetical protein